jgi:hypothetical protein
MKTQSQKIGRWMVAAFGAALLCAAPAQAQYPAYAPAPSSGGTRDLMARQAQFNRWLASVGNVPSAGAQGGGGGVQSALLRSQAIDQYVGQVGRIYGLPPAGPTTLGAKLNMAQEINRMSEHVLPSPLQGRERAIFLARLYYQTHTRTAQFLEAQGDRISAAALRQKAAYYLEVLRHAQRAPGSR